MGTTRFGSWSLWPHSLHLRLRRDRCQGLRQQTWLRRSLLKLWSTINEAKEDQPRPFWNVFAVYIEAEQKRREALLDWRMERVDSWLDVLRE